MTTDLAIVYSPVGGGHKAAAMAIAEGARARGARAEVISLFDIAPRVVGDVYLQAHLTGQNAIPALYGAAYAAANHRGGAFEPLRHSIDRMAFGALVQRIDALAPRAVIATHHLPLVVLGRARRRGRLAMPLIGMVTDYTAHACWAESGVDGFAVACRQAAHELVLHGIDRRRIAVTGIPVQPAFDRIDDVRDPVRSEALRVLVTSGGFGVGPLRRIVRSFAGMDGIHLTIVCGAQKHVYASISSDVRRLGLNAQVLGFEHDMPARMAAAHVVVGKAGGLTVSETLAAGRPMIVVNAIPGNEQINEAYVVEGGAGVHAAPRQAGARTLELFQRGVIASMGINARKLGRPGAAERIAVLSEATANLFRTHGTSSHTVV
ncbi:MAG TPA: glycosyltransferase [Polyangiaceae bacterium]|nr:glycosyltransferase [Polyangiaceae bacterium]